MFNLLMMFLVGVLPLVPGRITPELSKILKDTPPQEKIPVLVHMTTEYPYEEVKDFSPQEQCIVFKTIAHNSQKDILDYLRTLPEDKVEIVRQFWVFNGLHLKATKDVIMDLAQRSDIWFISPDLEYKGNMVISEYPDLRLTYWNIKKIMADSCWAAGYSGANVIIGDVGSGVAVNHPALANKWLSPYWLDPVSGMPTPYDSADFSTGMVSIMCGGDGPGPSPYDIGIAYGAKFIPTRTDNIPSSSNACLEYLANLKGQGVNIRVVHAHIYNNYYSYRLDWWQSLLTLRNLNILPVTTALPYTGDNSVCSPGNYPTVLAAGATNPIDYLSQGIRTHGPAPSVSPFTDPQYWYYSGWNRLKPDLLAPLDSVTMASASTGGYRTIDAGASPGAHVVGAAAILLERNPNLTVYELYELLTRNCDRIPLWFGQTNYPNNYYGWGRLNVWKALQNTPTPNKPNIVLRRTLVLNDNNGNGRLDPGETARIRCWVKNTGYAPATNTVAKLRTNNPYITLIDSTTNYGTIAPGDSLYNSSDILVISVSPYFPPSQRADFQLYISCAETSWVRTFSQVVGLPIPTDTGYYYCYWQGLPYREAPVFEWFPIDTTQTQNPGVSLDPQNERNIIVHLPFTFKYYGQNYNRITVNDNGWIGMDSITVIYFPERVPDYRRTYTVISPLAWPYYPTYPNHPSDIYYYYDEPNHRFVVEFFRMAVHGYPDSMMTFEVILYDPAYHPTPTGDGDIIFQYFDWTSCLPTVGIQNHTGAVGIGYYNHDGRYHPLAGPKFLSDSTPFVLKFSTCPPTLEIVGEEEDDTPKVFGPPVLRLMPNPFKGHLLLKYQIQGSTEGSVIKIYDVSGRLVKEWGDKEIGQSKILIWNGKDNLDRKVSAGVYFVSLEANGFKVVEKTVLLK